MDKAEVVNIRLSVVDLWSDGLIVSATVNLVLDEIPHKQRLVALLLLDDRQLKCQKCESVNVTDLHIRVPLAVDVVDNAAHTTRQTVAHRWKAVLLSVNAGRTKTNTPM